MGPVRVHEFFTGLLSQTKKIVHPATRAHFIFFVIVRNTDGSYYNNVMRGDSNEDKPSS